MSFLSSHSRLFPLLPEDSVKYQLLQRAAPLCSAHQPRHIPLRQAQPSRILLATLLARSCSREGLGPSIWSCPQPTRIAQNTEAAPYRTEADKASRSKRFQSSSPPGPPPHIHTCCSFFPSIYLLKTHLTTELFLTARCKSAPSASLFFPFPTFVCLHLSPTDLSCLLKDPVYGLSPPLERKPRSAGPASALFSAVSPVPRTVPDTPWGTTNIG